MFFHIDFSFLSIFIITINVANKVLHNSFTKPVEKVYSGTL